MVIYYLKLAGVSIFPNKTGQTQPYRCNKNSYNGFPNFACLIPIHSIIYGGWGGRILLLAGLAGILTSWNAFLVGGSRAIYALAHAGLLPAFLGRLHPKFNTPHNAVLMIGRLAMLAPFFGRQTLVWLVNAGGLGIVIAYAMVAVSFLVLRFREPELDRPYRVPAGLLVGGLALVLSVFLGLLYLPGRPAALAWPEEWVIIIIWTLLGGLFYSFAQKTR